MQNKPQLIITQETIMPAKKKEHQSKRVAPWVFAPAQTWTLETFENLNQAATYLINSAPPLYRQTLIELKGKFTADELRLMLDVMNGTMLTAEWPGATLAGNVRDGIALDALDEKWGINGKELTDKIDTLHVFQLHVLELWANSFWYGGDRSRELDIDAHVKPLL